MNIISFLSVSLFSYKIIRNISCLASFSLFVFYELLVFYNKWEKRVGVEEGGGELNRRSSFLKQIISHRKFVWYTFSLVSSWQKFLAHYSHFVKYYFQMLSTWLFFWELFKTLCVRERSSRVLPAEIIFLWAYII